MSEPPKRPPWWEGDYVWRPDGTEEALPAEPIWLEPIREPPGQLEPVLLEPVEDAPRSRPRECWRCGRAVDPRDTDCPSCYAGLRRRAPARSRGEWRRPTPRVPRTRGMAPMMCFFAAMLGVSVLQGILHFRLADKNHGITDDQSMRLTLIVEAVDTVLLLVALFVLPRPPRLPGSPTAHRTAAWLLGVPVLVVLLALNFAYHHLLRQFVGAPPNEPLAGTKKALDWLILLTVCLQPAIVEEVFFRYLCLGLLWRSIGLGGALLMSSVMFGLAHLGAPASMPILIVIGLGLALLRVMSRGLLLPMILHFLHNLVVVLTT